jgi:hypothetical protein
MKGQVSIEAIFIIGLATALILPASLLFYQFLMGSSADIRENTTTRIGKSFVENANLVYNYGAQAKITVELTFPDFITNMTVYNKSMLSISVHSEHGDEDYVFFFRQNVSAVFTEEDWAQGTRSFEFRTVSGGDEVSIHRI